MRYIYKAIVLCLIALLLVGTALPVAAEDMEFTMSVADISEFGDAKIITLDIDNDTGSPISFGWVGSCEVLVTTAEGTYSTTPHMLKAGQGNSTLNITVPSCPGEVEKIEITDLRLLSDDGLPNEQLENIVIYDTAAGITSYSGEFSSLSGVPTFVWIGLGIFAVVAIGIACIIAFVIDKQKKARAAKVNAFAPFGENMAGINMAQQMHNQAHQQFNQQMNQQQFNDFTRQSGTTMDMGGFIPPPPPPPPGV